MITIKAETIADAWRKACISLYSEGFEIKDEEFLRNSSIAIEVNDTTTDLFDERFTMAKNDVDIINDFLITGNNEDKVIHDWTKLYHKRLFGADYNQIENIIEYLTKKPLGMRAQASVWRQEEDLYGGIGPCLQLVWFQVIKEKLEVHVHMRATDAYGKLLMNMNEFVALQHYVAKRLNREPGKYIQFTDSCHFYSKNQSEIEKLIESIK